MASLLSKINSFVWGAPLILLILGIGIILTIGTKTIQLRRLPLALKYMVKMKKVAKEMLRVFRHCAQHCQQRSELEISSV